MRIKPSVVLLALASALPSSHSAAQEDERAQYPWFLAKSYVGVDFGYINYPFSAAQLEPGYQVESVKVPHFAVRLALLGYRFNDAFSAQITYMRPALWVRYHNINGVPRDPPVFMNIAGATLRAKLPLKGRLALSGEAGLGLITRSGFALDGTTVVTDAKYATVLLGAGLQYRLNPTWDLGARATYSPARAAEKQPHTVFFSAGATINLNPLSADRVAENAQAAALFPRGMIQVGYTTDAFGVGVNHFVSKTIPIFWGGLAVPHHGLSLHYQRNVFHRRKLFSLDTGASVSYWISAKEKQSFYTLSVFPVFRFTPLRTRAADLYFAYSLAGPTYISRTLIDGAETGRHFTFQDFMGLGMYLGRHRNLNAEVRIGHYSNGNLFPKNSGVSIPLTFNLGYTF